jgi:Cupin-like domain
MFGPDISFFIRDNSGDHEESEGGSSRRRSSSSTASGKKSSHGGNGKYKYRGIGCRFAVSGLISASHFDGARNFVAMVRGRKRYILMPPQECKKLYLNTDENHPMFRQSTFDWSSKHEVAAHPNLLTARATEVVLSMGEVLYIPSYWFHYIVSQDASIQCNAWSGQSGDPREGPLDVRQLCDF